MTNHPKLRGSKPQPSLRRSPVLQELGWGLGERFTFPRAGSVGCLSSHPRGLPLSPFGVWPELPTGGVGGGAGFAAGEQESRKALQGSASEGARHHFRAHPVGAASPRAAPMPGREFDSASWCGALHAGTSPAPSAGVPALQTLYHGALLALTTIVSSARLPSPWAHVSSRSASVVARLCT